LVSSLKEIVFGKDKMPKNFYQWEEIKKHNKENDCWVVMKGVVYDISKYINEHPGFYYF
jgi:cytochrome b involved in lipid metabolism